MLVSLQSTSFDVSYGSRSWLLQSMLLGTAGLLAVGSAPFAGRADKRPVSASLPRPGLCSFSLL
jgi:hypothetical protein